MPLYEYECEVCATRFERIRKFSDPPLEACPSCNGAVRKLFSSPAIHFKGAGWYITDYAKKGGSADAADKPESGADAKSGGDKPDTSDKSDRSDKSDKSDKRGKSEASGSPAQSGTGGAAGGSSGGPSSGP